MTKINKNKDMKEKKKRYFSPLVEKIVLDKDISIQMTSPPGDPFDQPEPYIKKGADNYDVNPFT